MLTKSTSSRMGQGARGPWNEGDGWQLVEAPALNVAGKAEEK
jgi:hypothetical protein